MTDTQNPEKIIMENNVEVRTGAGPPGISCLIPSTVAAAVNGDTFRTTPACGSGTNPFKDQLGEISKDLFHGMVKAFGNEAKKNDQGRSPQASRNCGQDGLILYIMS